jgi:hypothetical protein
MEKAQKKKILFIGLGTITTAVLGFFGWQALKDKKETKQKKNTKTSTYGTSSPTTSNPISTTKSDTSHSYAPAGSTGFPLQKGSRGNNVKALQQALIAKYGASIMPRYGADGDFGNETAAALKTAGLPSSIDLNTFNSLTGNNTNTSTNTNSSGGGVSPIDPVAVSGLLHDAIDAVDIEKGITALKFMNTTDDYVAVNKEFETTTVMFVRKTIVTGMLECFTDESQKVRIRLEFTRMGLKYDGTKFSLSGLPYRLITANGTSVFDKDGKETGVKRNMALGNPVGVRDGWVYFFPFNAHILLRVKKKDVIIHKNNNQ